MKITIETIPHDQQRFPTWAGDWQIDQQGNIAIQVSELGDWRYEALVIHHELTEVLLCKARGITTEMVDAFCATVTERRAAGTVDETDHDKTSPSHREHLFAENLERMLAFELGVDWDEYGEAMP
jgi:hypothetical protein